MRILSRYIITQTSRRSEKTVLTQHWWSQIASLAICRSHSVPGRISSICLHWWCELDSRHVRDWSWYCHIYKIALSTTPDLCFYIHQLQSTFAQLAVRTLQTSLYILLHYVPCTFDPSVLDSLLGFHHSCVQLWTQLWLYFSSIPAFVCIEYNPNSISIYKLDVLST